VSRLFGHLIIWGFVLALCVGVKHGVLREFADLLRKEFYKEVIMNRILIALVLTGVLGLYCGIANAGSFTANVNGTVTDNVTNLMWQQCSDGLSGAGCVTGTAATATWDNAIAYCEGLSLGGFTDWRLPNIKELKSIADMTTSNPSINATFPSTMASNYWSSTSYALITADAWSVGFSYGYTFANVKTGAGYVRCVRGQ